jgi:hypothetical protein
MDVPKFPEVEFTLFGVADCSFGISSGNFKYKKNILTILPARLSLEGSSCLPRRSGRSYWGLKTFFVERIRFVDFYSWMHF